VQNWGVLEAYRLVAEAYGRLSFVTKAALIGSVFLITSGFGIAVVVLLPADHFTRGPQPGIWWRRHQAIRWTVLVLKNALGAVMFILGIVMSLPLVPGPGLVFILVGLSLLDFPGKRRLERRLLVYPRVRRFLDRVRERFGRPPLEIPPRLEGPG